MEITVLLIHPDGRLEDRRVQNNSLRDLQALVAGSIEIVMLDDDVCLVVNEEGNYTAEPINMTATTLARDAGALVLAPGLRGTAFVTSEDDEGEMLSVSDVGRLLVADAQGVWS